MYELTGCRERKEDKPVVPQLRGSGFINTAIHPSMTDYCDKEQLSRQQAILNRLQQSGSALESELKVIETTEVDLEKELKQHKITATKARDYYKTGVGNSGKQSINSQLSSHQQGVRERISGPHSTASHLL